MLHEELVEKLKNLEAIAYGYNINGEVLGMDCSDFEQIMVDAADSITDLLSRAEAAEACCKRLDEELKAHSKTDLAKAHEALSADWAKQKLRAEAAEAREKNLIEAVQMITARAEKAENIASDLCDDFTDFVTGGVPNAAPYCANCRPECINARGWCNGDNSVCKGFLPKAAIQKEE